jgi:DNA polymerase III epsilon subunit-like protein
MVMFTDTETTGLPPKGAHWEVDYELFPYLLSIAWKIGNKEKYYLIHQEGRAVPGGATAVNGITTKMANDKNSTYPIRKVIKEFIEDAEAAQVHTVVGHNLYFDASTIKANVLREWGPNSKEAKRIKEVLHKDKRIDTMRYSQILTRKWLKLPDLYMFLFGKEMSGAHNALADTIACEECYKELCKRKVI